jgi:hypothetical protein
MGRVGVFLVVALVAACDVTPHVRSSLQVASRKWVAVDCTAAAREGFRGVDLADEAGNRMRLMPEPDGRVTVIAFPADGSEAQTMPSCGTMDMPVSHLRVMGVPSESGSAQLDCRADSFSIRGTIEFENCH